MSEEYSIENDPLMQPLSEEKRKIIDKAVSKQIKSLSLDENVDKDIEQLSGQKYALISIVSPNSNQKYEHVCLKIKGVFGNLDDANKHAEMLQKIDSTFDIYVVEMYSWLLVPPDPTLIEQKHVDSKLNEIIGGHRENQLRAKEYFNERKRELIENISIENERRKNEPINEEEEEEEEEEEKYGIKIEDITESDSKPESKPKSEPESEPESEPSGVSAGSGFNITDNSIGGNCPNSGPDSEEHTTPSELMNAMVNDSTNNKPSKSWADSVEEEN
jgi:hypothetical protein